MELELGQCGQCARIFSPASNQTSQCETCQQPLVPLKRCAWCVQLSKDLEYCEHCGSVMVELTHFGAARLLRKTGNSKISLAAELHKLTPEQRQQSDALCTEQRAVFARLLDLIRSIDELPNGNKHVATLTENFFLALPLADDDFNILQTIAETSNSASFGLAASLKLMAEQQVNDLLHDIAWITLIYVPDAVIGSDFARDWLSEVAQIGLDEKEQTVEALIALAHWRTAGAPFFQEVYRGELGKKFYNAAFAKLHTSHATTKIWMAVLAARTETYLKTPPGDKLKRQFLELLNLGAVSKDLTLAIACAVALKDEQYFARLLTQDSQELKDYAITRLAALRSPAIIPLISAGDSKAVNLVVDSILSNDTQAVPRPLLVALLQGAHGCLPDLVDQIISIALKQAGSDSSIYSMIDEFVTKRQDPGLALAMLTHTKTENSAALQRLVAPSIVHFNALVKLEEISRHAEFIPELAEAVVRLARQLLRSPEFENFAESLRGIVVNQMDPSSKSGFLFRHFLLEHLFSANPNLSNRVYGLMAAELSDLFLDTLGEETRLCLFSHEFCEVYFGSVDNFLQSASYMLRDAAHYQCYAWVLGSVLDDPHIRRTLISNPAACQLMLSEVVRAYVANPTLEVKVTNFLCQAEADGTVPLLELVTVDQFSPALFNLLASASSRCIFPRRLLVEALQFLELKSDPDYRVPIRSLLIDQGKRDATLAYIAYDYLIKSAVNAADPHAADNAFEMFEFVRMAGLAYRSRDESVGGAATPVVGAHESVIYQITDFVSLIRNFFGSFANFSHLLKNLLDSPHLFASELWLLSLLRRHADVIQQKCKAGERVYLMFILALVDALGRKKYSSTALKLAADCLAAYIPPLSCADYIKTDSLQALHALVKSENSESDEFEVLFGHVRMLGKEIQRIHQSLFESKLPVESEPLNRPVLPRGSTEIFTADLSQHFEVSLAWAMRFGRDARKYALSRLSAVLTSMLNHSLEFRHLLEKEEVALVGVLDALIDLLFTNEEQRDEHVTEKLLASELIFVLARDSSWGRYCVERIKRNALRMAQGAVAQLYTRRIVDALSESHLAQATEPMVVGEADEKKSELKVLSEEPVYAPFTFESEDFQNQLSNTKAIEYINLGEDRVRQGDYMGAASYFKSALELEDDDRIAYLVAKVFLLLNQPEQATRYIHRCLVRNPNNWEALILYAYQLERFEKNYRFAVELAKRAYQIEPTSVRVLSRLSSIYIKLGEHAQATRLLQAAVKLAPRDPELFFQLGDILYNSKRYDDAIRNYQKSLSLKGDAPLAYVALGKCYTMLGKPKQSEAHFRKALVIDEACASAYNALGNLYLFRNHKENAKEFFARACRLEGQNFDYKKDYAGILRVCGETGAAIEVLTELVSVAEADRGLLKDLATAYQEEKRYPEAQATLTRAIQLDPDNYRLYFALARCYQGSNDNGSAAGVLQRALVLQPDYIDAWMLLADIYMRLERLDQAEESYSKALGLDAHNTRALNGLAGIYCARGEFAQAEKYYQESLSYDADNADTHCYFGNALLAGNRFSESTEYYQKAIELKPDYVVAYINLGHAFYNAERFDEAALSYKQGAVHSQDPDALQEYLLNVVPYVQNSALRQEIEGLLKNTSSATTH